MENTISKKLIQTISENETTFLDDKLLSKYENAIKEFDDLVKKGFAKKRENNLLSFTETHLHRITLETYKNSFARHGFTKSVDEVLPINITSKTNFNNFNKL